MFSEKLTLNCSVCGIKKLLPRGKNYFFSIQFWLRKTWQRGFGWVDPNILASQVGPTRRHEASRSAHDGCLLAPALLFSASSLPTRALSPLLPLLPATPPGSRVLPPIDRNGGGGGGREQDAVADAPPSRAGGRRRPPAPRPLRPGVPAPRPRLQLRTRPGSAPLWVASSSFS